MPPNLTDLLNEARRSQFVGRESELALFRSLLDDAESSFHLLHVFGPGGVGKSSLLREYQHHCDQHGADRVLIDATEIEPTPDTFTRALGDALQANGCEPIETLSSRASERHQVLFIDTYERLRPLDNWLRERFLPQMPINSTVVLAGREPPTVGWRRDPGWQQLMQVIDLRNLTRRESQMLLTRRHIPDPQQQTILAFTHGHPLALSLVADVFDQRADLQFDPSQNPDIIGTLVEQLLDEVPGPGHRAALEVCALARGTTEALLEAVLDTPNVHDLFDWLRHLSFMNVGVQGIYPHDLARQALLADLRWRNPDRFRVLHERVRLYYRERLSESSLLDQQRILFDYVYLHRDNPMVAPFFEWQTSEGMLSGRYRPADKPGLLAMTEQHEGAASARILDHWLEQQPHNCLVFRTVDDVPTGFMLALNLEVVETVDANIDPAVEACLGYLEQHAPLRTQERATLFRFWLDHELYQSVSPVQSFVFIHAVRHYLTTPGLAYTFFPCSDPDFWAAVFAYAELTRLPAADFSVDDRSFGVYGHDWRVMPPLTWLDVLAQKELSTDSEPSQPPAVHPVVVLSESDFAEAVRDLLRNFHRPDQLLNNPLLWSRLLDGRVDPQASLLERADAVRSLIEEIADLLLATPKEARYHRVLHATYLIPKGTQEQVAEHLDLPMGTYRRHLRTGIQRLTALLWQQETAT